VGDDDGSSDGGSSDDNEEELDARSNDPEEDESEGDHTSELHMRVHTPGNSDASSRTSELHVRVHTPGNTDAPSPGDAPPKRRPFHDKMAALTRVILFDNDGAKVGPMYEQEGDAEDEEMGSSIPIAAEGLPTHFVSIDVATTGKNIVDDKIIRLAVNVRNEDGETLYDYASYFSNGNILIRSSGLGAPFGLTASDLGSAGLRRAC